MWNAVFRDRSSTANPHNTDYSNPFQQHLKKYEYPCDQCAALEDLSSELLAEDPSFQDAMEFYQRHMGLPDTGNTTHCVLL